MLRSTTARRPKSAFRPEFEALEQRTLLNATAFFSAGTITITGDNTPNKVEILDDGNVLPTDKVTVLVNGQQALQVDARTVSAINFRMGKKNDEVRYTLNGTLSAGTLSNLPGHTRAITGNLGPGNDSFLAVVQPFLIFPGTQMSIDVQGGKGNDVLTLLGNADILFGCSFRCTFDGGSGNDSLFVNAQQATVGHSGLDNSPGVDVNASSMDIRLLGGQGKDTFELFYGGNLNGDLHFLVDGGPGDDTVRAVSALFDQSGLGTASLLDEQVLGQQGKDNLSLKVVNTSPGAVLTINATVNGGPQTDTISTAGSNVPVTVIQ
jgi:hypothetical protein